MCIFFPYPWKHRDPKLIIRKKAQNTLYTPSKRPTSYGVYTNTFSVAAAVTISSLINLGSRGLQNSCMEPLYVSLKLFWVFSPHLLKLFGRTLFLLRSSRNDLRSTKLQPTLNHQDDEQILAEFSLFWMSCPFQLLCRATESCLNLRYPPGIGSGSFAHH